MKPVNLSSLVAEIFERWPNTVDLFMQNRMGCPGCYLAKFEELEGALSIYNISEDQFLEKLQKIIDEGK